MRSERTVKQRTSKVNTKIKTLLGTAADTAKRQHVRNTLCEWQIWQHGRNRIYPFLQWTSRQKIYTVFIWLTCVQAAQKFRVQAPDASAYFNTSSTFVNETCGQAGFPTMLLFCKIFFAKQDTYFVWPRLRDHWHYIYGKSSYKLKYTKTSFDNAP